MTYLSDLFIYEVKIDKRSDESYAQYALRINDIIQECDLRKIKYTYFWQNIMYVFSFKSEKAAVWFKLRYCK